MSDSLPPDVPAAPRAHGALFWIAIIGGGLALLCGGVGVVVYFAVGRDLIAMAKAPESERMAMMSTKLEQVAGNRVPAIDKFLAAVGERRNDDAWTLLTPGFQAATPREKFDKLVSMVDDVMGRLKSRQIRSYNVRADVGGPTVSSFVLAGAFEKGEGTIALDLEPAGDGWLVRRWRTDSPLFNDVLLRGAKTK